MGGWGVGWEGKGRVAEIGGVVCGGDAWDYGGFEGDKRVWIRVKKAGSVKALERVEARYAGGRAAIGERRQKSQEEDAVVVEPHGLWNRIKGMFGRN